MRALKSRLTVTVAPDLVKAGQDAVAAGDAASLSAWVSLALTDRAMKDLRRRALGQAVAAYEAEFGVITAKELVEQARADRQGARVVRGGVMRGRKGRRGRRGAVA